jgi:hypothetical protein
MMLSELSESETSPSSSQVAPLALSTVKLRYPRLYREYCILSDREGEWVTCGTNSSPSPIDDDTGLHTTICFTDFATPLDDNDGCPMTADSDANRFSIFVWKCLTASESGSGDACRQFDVLNSALDDAVAFSSPRDRFVHLLGWTYAALNHGLYSLLCGGDTDRNRSLFKAAADVWKKAYDETPPGGGGGDDAGGLSWELRDFAIWTCRNLQILLRDAKMEGGGNVGVSYAFNFIRKPRAKKGTAHANATASSSLSSGPVPSVGDIGVGVKCKKNTVEITVTRLSTEQPLGIGIIQERYTMLGLMKVKSIFPNSIFLGTPLTVGMILETVNGRKYSSFEKGMELLKNADGKITVGASLPYYGPPAPTATAAPAAASSIVGATTHQDENSIPAANRPTSESVDLNSSPAFDGKKSDVAKREAPANGGDDSVKKKKAKAS